MLFISAGHHQAAKGAEYKGFNEHDEAQTWVSLIANHLGSDCMVVPTGYLRDKVAFINTHTTDVQKDLAVEVHFNSAVKDGVHIGKGSECLFYPTSIRGYLLAEAVQETLGELFPPNRGVKEGWYRMKKTNGPDFFLERTSCTALILEPEFIHRKAKIQQKRETACKQIAEALMTFILNEDFK